MLMKLSEMQEENERYIRRHKLAKGPRNQYPAFHTFSDKPMALIEWKIFELDFMFVPKLVEQVVPNGPYEFNVIEMK